MGVAVGYRFLHHCGRRFKRTVARRHIASKDTVVDLYLRQR